MAAWAFKDGKKTAAARDSVLNNREDIFNIGGTNNVKLKPFLMGAPKRHNKITLVYNKITHTHQKYSLNGQSRRTNGHVQKDKIRWDGMGWDGGVLPAHP